MSFHSKYILSQTRHRPWPMKSTPWVMKQIWHDLLFAHWPISLDNLRSIIPSCLDIDTYDGQAWLGIVPFGMRHVTPRGMPPLPWLSAFHELNVRTYVKIHDKPGVFFFSLDAANPVAVQVARKVFYLPYFDAVMSLKYLEHETIQYYNHRTHKGAPDAFFAGRYRPISEVYLASSGTLEHWLTERYCLYAYSGKQLYRGEIHHIPWPLQRAEADIYKNTMAQAANLELPDVSPLLHFAKEIEVVVWPLEKVF